MEQVGKDEAGQVHSSQRKLDSMCPFWHLMNTHLHLPCAHQGLHWITNKCCHSRKCTNLRPKLHPLGNSPEIQILTFSPFSWLEQSGGILEWFAWPDSFPVLGRKASRAEEEIKCTLRPRKHLQMAYNTLYCRKSHHLRCKQLFFSFSFLRDAPQKIRRRKKAYKGRNISMRTYHVPSHILWAETTVECKTELQFF